MAQREYPCEYPACSKIASWIVEKPADWTHTVCDEHLGALIVEGREGAIIFEVEPIRGEVIE